MSLSNNARLMLLAGSSLNWAALGLVASLGLAAPGSALAANECGNPGANGSAADTFTCPVQSYATGVQHTSNGDLSVTVQTGSSFGTGGVVSTGAASDDLTLRLTGSGSTTAYSFSTAFPALLNAESQSGDVLVEVQTIQTTANESGAPTISTSNAATTRVIRAVSAAGGDVTVRNLSVSGGGVRNGEIRSSTNASAIAIEARSTGGGDVTVDLGAGFAVGRLYGILAQADGAGAITITGSAQANNSTAGSAGLRAIAGTGPVTIAMTPLTGGTDSSRPFTGRTGVYVSSGGDVTFTGVGEGVDYGIDIANVAAGTTTTLNLAGRRNSGGAVIGSTGGLAAIRAQGAGSLLVNVTGAQRAMNFDFTGMATPVDVVFRSGGAWAPATNATTHVATANYSITIESGAALIVGEQNNLEGFLEPVNELVFTTPGSTLNNAGTIVVGPDSSTSQGMPRASEIEFRLVGLDEFHHSGTVMLGAKGSFGGAGDAAVLVQGSVINQTDRWYDDMMVFREGTWMGEEGKVVFDVDISRTQANCTRTSGSNDFAAADCLRFVDADVEGLTYISLVDILGGDRGRLTEQIMTQGIVLIEANPGSTVSADNFALDPGMTGYNPASGAYDKGLYQYALAFDEAAGQFRLLGGLSAAAYELPMAATAAHSLWRLSTGSWLERQADLRSGFDDGAGGGVWLRVAAEQADRDVINATSAGQSLDSTHQAQSYAFTGGLDLISSSDGSTGYVVGVMAGYAHSDIEYGVSRNAQAMDGWTGGAYASVIHGGLYVDAVINVNNVILDTDAPGFNLLPEGAILSSRLLSVGGQVEAGWRFGFGGGFFAEPLAGVSYVRSRMDELRISPDDFSRPGLEVSYDDPRSLRAGVGGRLGMDREFVGMRTQLSVLSRLWNDLESENTATIHNLAFPDDPDIGVTDDVSGRFGELQVGAAIYSPGGVVSGFLRLGGRFADDYEARTGSMGVRVAW